MERFRHTESASSFFSLVSPSGCWEWRGARDKDGYGQTRVRLKRVKAHRKAWEIVNGPIPEGMMVLHHCDNPSCVRPNHLFLGTAATNRRDVQSKGRLVGIGSRLDRKQVVEIRTRYATGTVSQKALAEEFGVTQTTISRVVRNKIWRI